MRLFQNSGTYAGYRPRLSQLTAHCISFADYRSAVLHDRYSACHVLQPVLRGDEDAFFTNGDDAEMQGRWARERSSREGATLEGVLLSQIEEHRTEVFYNLDPMRYGNSFVRRLPGCVKHTLAWRAAPSAGHTFEEYDRVVCNFPRLLRDHEARGAKVAYFSPAHDPVMDSYADNTKRPVDVLFVGGYSRHHRRRAEVLEAVSGCSPSRSVIFHLDRSRLTKLVESPLGSMLPGFGNRRPKSIRAVTAEPVFGLDLYSALSQAKIVLNGAVDIAGNERGNMRCWEAMGCGAVMLSDEGVYPPGIQAGRDFETYAGAHDVVKKIQGILSDYENARAMAERGRLAVSTGYSKAKQWQSFLEIVAGI